MQINTVNTNVNKFCDYVKKEDMLKGCSESQMKKIATYIEEKFLPKTKKGSYYVDAATSGVNAAIEYDEKSNKTFIHFFDKKLGEGYWKKGTYSIVYDPKHPLPCIRLTMKDDKINKKDAMEKFKAEIGRSKALSHGSSHLVKTIAAIPYKKKNKEKVALIQELYTNGSLSALVSKHPELLTTAKKLKIASGMLAGLKEIHDQNYLHRDFHSGNVFIDKNFDSYIGDFGWATREKKAIDRPAQSRTQITAPELLANTHPTIGDYKKGEFFTAGLNLYQLTYEEKLDLKQKEIANVYKKIKKQPKNEKKAAVAELKQKINDITKKNRTKLEEKVAKSGESSLSPEEALEYTTLELLHTDATKRKSIEHWIAFLNKAQKNAEDK